MLEELTNIKIGDAIQGMKELPDNSVDCVITDPPYPTISGGSGPNDQVQRPTGMLSKNDGKIFEYNNIHISKWIGEVYRVLKEGTHLYLMTNFLNLQEYMEEIQKVGFEIHNLLVWKKNNATPNRWYMKNCEYIIFARKGAAKPINDCGYKTVLEFDNPRNKIHPTEKPIDLLQALVKNSSKIGDVILDPFGGSLSTAFASISTGRKVISWELSEEYFNLGMARLVSAIEEGFTIEPPRATRLTDNQKAILAVLEENPESDFTGAELSAITGIPSRTCSGCITPLVSAGKAYKTNKTSPFKIRLRVKED